MRQLIFPLTLALVSQALIGCGNARFWIDSVRGDGVMKTEERVVAAFDAIEMRGGMDLKVRVGSESLVLINADSNLQNYIVTEVKDGTLKIWYERSVRSDQRLTAEIGMPSLTGIEISGSSRLDVSGLQEASFDVDVSGSARGTIEGRVDHLDIDIAGSSNLDCSNLEATDVAVSIAGSARIKTYATNSLDVGVAGSGEVLYRGQPSVTVDQAGSARVQALPPSEENTDTDL